MMASEQWHDRDAVVADSEDGRLDLDDGSLTENTRSCYPIDFIPNTVAGAPLAGTEALIRALGLRAVGGRTPLAPLHYAYQWRRGDTRALVAAMLRLVQAQVDFSAPPALAA